VAITVRTRGLQPYRVHFDPDQMGMGGDCDRLAAGGLVALRLRLKFMA
jgi:hypothetical protein